MLDIHAHILPFLDDGAKSYEMTLDMLRMAEEDGITHVVATPHYICGASHYDKRSLFSIYERINKLLNDNEIGITLLLGNELFLDEYTLDHLKKGRCLTLGHSKYVLIEFSLTGILQNAETLICGLVNSGYVPILAHVERYHNVTENPNLLLNFMDLGCLLQVNSSSIIGLAGKKAIKTAMELIFRNMVSIVASDCHSNKGRSPKLSQAFHIISSCVDIQKAEQLFTTNPLKVVNNQDVTIDGEMIHNRRFRKFLSC